MGTIIVLCSSGNEGMEQKQGVVRSAKKINPLLTVNGTKCVWIRRNCGLLVLLSITAKDVLSCLHNPKQSELTVPNSLHSACPQEQDLDVPIFVKESLRSDPWEGEEAQITKVSFSASSTQEQSKALEEIQIQMWIAQFQFLPCTTLHQHQEELIRRLLAFWVLSQKAALTTPPPFFWWPGTGAGQGTSDHVNWVNTENN